MKLLKNIFLLLCVTIHHNPLSTMEKTDLSPEKQLLIAVKAREIDIVKESLSTFSFDFISLSVAYTWAFAQAKKLTPNKTIRQTSDMQEAIQKIQTQREFALNKLTDLDTLQSQKGITYTKTRKDQVDETLIQQGKSYLICAQLIYPYMEPLITEDDNCANILCSLIGEKGYLDWLQKYVTTYKQFIDWNYCDRTGKTVLHFNPDNLDIVEYLLNNTNIDCNQQTYYNRDKNCPHETVLHLAAQKHQTEVVRFLLKNKSNPNIRNHFGQLPLHYVAPGSNGNREIFEMLLAAGTHIDSHIHGKTLLYKAVEINNPYIVEYLLKLEANPNANRKTLGLENQIYPDMPELSTTPSDLATTNAIAILFLSSGEGYIQTKKDNQKIITLLKQYSK